MPRDAPDRLKPLPPTACHLGSITRDCPICLCPAKPSLRGSVYCPDKLQAVPAWPYLHLTWHEPSPLHICGPQSIYFPGKKIGSHGVILSSHFPHSTAFRCDFQMVLEDQNRLNARPSCPTHRVVRWAGEQRGKMGFAPHVKKREGWIQLAERRALILRTWMGRKGLGIESAFARSPLDLFYTDPPGRKRDGGAEPAPLLGWPEVAQQVSTQQSP